MRFTKTVSIVGLVIYLFLWVLALNGASSLIVALTVPLVLAILVAFGVWLNRFMGITPRAQHFAPRTGPSVEGVSSPGDAAPFPSTTSTPLAPPPAGDEGRPAGDSS